MLEIMLSGTAGVFRPVVQGKTVYDSDQKSGAGRLEWSMPPTAATDLVPGSLVTARWQGTVFFIGYLFTIRRSMDGAITAIAYDALRYFANRDTYVCEGLTADGLLRRICTDFHLPAGQITPTGYVLPARVEQSCTLFEMMHHALDATWQATGRRYFMDCYCGSIRLLSDDARTSGVTVDDSVITALLAEDTIDREVYTRVRLRRYDRHTGSYQITTLQSSLAAGYGVLQYDGRVEENQDAVTAAQNILAAGSHLRRQVHIDCAAGNLAVIGGRRLTLALRHTNTTLSGSYRCISARHIWQGKTHRMQLVLQTEGN